MGYRLRYLEQQKSGVFRYRRDFPSDVGAILDRKTFKQSLKTKDEDLALERWKVVDSEVKQLIAQCRSGKIRSASLSDKAISAIASNHGAEILARDQKVRVGGYSKLSPTERFPFWESEVEEFEDIGGCTPITPEQAVLQQQGMTEWIILDLKHALTYDSYDELPDEVEDRILARLKKEGFKGKPSPEVFRPFVEAELKALEGILSRCEGQSVSTPDLVPVNKHLLSVEAEKWSALKLQRKEWKPKTAQSFLAAMRLFIEVQGDKDISEYIKDDARKFQEILIVYPANVWKFPELKDMTPKEIVQRGMKPMSKNNASKIFVFVGSFFRYALKSYDTMKANPFDGQSIKKEDNSDSRVPYTVDELNILFSSSLYHLVKSKTFCHHAGSVSMKDTGRFWLPLIALFTGMRMNEIAQIHREDIRLEAGFLIFDLCKGEGKDFKTKASLRHIPVHHELLKCGLLQFRDAAKSERMFPEMKRGKDGTFSYNYSKWYSRFLKGIGIKRVDLVFHSFRHLFEEAAMRTGMQDSMVDSLQGHKLDKMKAVYVQNVDLQMKNEFVQKIKYEGLDLSHIYV